MTSVRVAQPSHRIAEQCALLLVLAWLPSLAFAGHWSALAAPITGRSPAHVAHASSEPHRQHCHADLEDCAGGSSMSMLPAAPAPPAGLIPAEAVAAAPRSEERRVGKECRSRSS